MHQNCGEWIGDIHIFSQRLNGLDITQEIVPSIIDELPIIAVLASQADSPTTVCGAEELRVKECDRIRAVCENLLAMGGEVIEKKDGFIINQCNTLYNTNIKAIFLHDVLTDLALAYSLPDIFQFFESYIKTNHSAIPAYATKNLPTLFAM